MGRAPCCDKANVKRGPWSPEEDAKLKSYIDQNGTGGNWIALPQKIGLKRCGKSCRLRWLNYLRPNIKHGGFSEEEDNLICSLYISIGSRWSIIAAQLPGRTDNDIKNYWNTRLKKKLLGKQRKDRRQIAAASGAQHQAAAHHSSACSTTTTTSTVHDSLVVSGLPNNHHHYWPEAVAAAAGLPPIPYSSEEPRLNDHTSIRKLLIKLGGRFSNSIDTTVHQDHHRHHQQLISHNTTTTTTTTTTTAADQFQAAGAVSSSSNGMVSPSAEAPLLLVHQQRPEAIVLDHHEDEYYRAVEMLQANSSGGVVNGQDGGLEFLLSGSADYQELIMVSNNGDNCDHHVHHQLVYDDHLHQKSIEEGDRYGFDDDDDDLSPYPEARSM